MKHKFLTRLAALGLCAALCGCSLADPALGPAADPAAAPEGDVLIGGFVTEDYLDLFDMEAYLNDALNGGFRGGEVSISAADTAEYSGRIYGTLTEDRGVSFPGVAGVALLLNEWTAEDGGNAISIDGSDIFTDRGIESHSSDEGESRLVKATLYVDRALVKERTIGFYLNPIYRTPDGQVYLTAGTGSHMNLSEHGSNGTMSKTVRASATTKTADGKTETVERGVKVSLGVAWAARTVTLLQLDADHKVLKTETWPADALPADEMDAPLLLEPDTAYVLLERHYTDHDGRPGVERDVYSLGDLQDYDGDQKLCVSLMIPGEPYARQTGLWLQRP